ncbi:ATP-binding protein [Nucisporomicrobium flavum]|uniref:ATP-binding protein n=1 Tax=Nucisporomicrobium flavum TaxID=2785915 RepID=UPI0018F3A2CE|nr:ATP-binding protein [Nucisporomicrobium flavum]
MKLWPQWNRRLNPGGLVQYVQSGTAATLLPELSPRAEGRGGAPLNRLRTAYDLFAVRGIRYADEPLASGDGWQEIRPASEVVAKSRQANCVDMAVAFAGACLDTGIHPVVILLEPRSGGPGHALVAVWLDREWIPGGHRRYGDAAPALVDGQIDWPDGLRSAPDSPGGFLAVDVAELAVDEPDEKPITLEQAVARAAQMLSSPRWRVCHLVDVGRDYDRRGAFLDPARSTRGITSHAEERAALSDMRQNLLESNLPYVPPADPAAPTRPENLLRALTAKAAQYRGVLLHGVAGVGKTRTTFEVARLAEKEGWSVLHVAPLEPMVTVEQLYDAITEERSSRVLVICDYLNDSVGIDVLRLESWLLPRTTADGIEVALLACSRTGWFNHPDRPFDPVFDGLQLAPDPTQAEATRDAILRALAPHAIEAVGLPRLREVCGLRPVIVMLIAREAEGQSDSGRLGDLLTGMTHGELLPWLKLRLRRDKLLRDSGNDPFVDGQGDPSGNLLGCLSILLASPQPRADLHACAATVPDLPEDAAELMLAELESMGWLIPVAEGHGPVHDLVTDQLAARILLYEGTHLVRTRALTRVLSAAPVRGRTIGRFAMNLGRVIRDLDPAEAQALTADTERWLAENGVKVAAVLAQTDNEGAYALGAVIESVAWRNAIYALWTSVVDPWLAKHSQSPDARHLLYRGLRAEDCPARSDLASLAMRWLDRHVSRLDASFVISPVLALQHSLDPAVSKSCVAYALAWLDQHGTDPSAGFVYYSLLPRDDLGDRSAAAVGHALAWLDQHGTGQSAQFVYSGLLARDDLGDRSAVAVGHALAWLDQHGTGQSAGFVYSGLLARDDLGGRSAAAVGHALAWLDQHGTGQSAGFVYSGLLARDDLGGRSAVAVGHALAWLDLHGTGAAGGFVLRGLLARDDLGGRSAAAVGHALAWLDQHGTDQSAQFVYYSLLPRNDLGGRSAAAVGHALAWLDQHGTGPSADFVLRGLLARDDLGDRSAAAVGHALAWLDQHGTGAAGGFVLRGLLARDDLGGRSAAAVGHALAWLDQHGTGPSADFVLRGLLARDDLGGRSAAAVGHALAWLDQHGTGQSAQFVYSGLLARDDLGDRSAAAVGHALAWLDQRGTGPAAAFVYDSLLGRSDLADLASDHDRIHRMALNWIVINLVQPSFPQLMPTPIALPVGPRLADMALTFTETVMRLSAGKWKAPNAYGQFDRFLSWLCSLKNFKNGIRAARLDDAICAWVRRPESLQAHGTEICLPLFSRILSLMLMHRRDLGDAEQDLARLEKWVGAWTCSEERQGEALRDIQLYARLLATGDR